jgi:hypothetical protein
MSLVPQHQQIAPPDVPLSKHSLPYIDKDPLDNVALLIQQELDSSTAPPPPTSTPTDPPPPSSSADSIDLDRYSDPRNSAVAYEYERRRGNHLDLMLEYGADSYRDYLSSLDRVCGTSREMVHSLRSDVDGVNKHRKYIQEAAAGRLSVLYGKFMRHQHQEESVAAQK